jgi:nicotinate-nucleotide pyrophosphorylase (carboxylating)
MPTLNEQAVALARHPSTSVLLELAITEDIGKGDVTSQILVDPTMMGRARIIARESGVVCGLPIAARAAAMIDDRIGFEISVEEGAQVAKGTLLAHVVGPAAALLASERLILNLLQRMSGIASVTRRYVDAVAHHDCVVLETRKTIPAFRLLDKYAVRAGGGQNHRMGLFDQILAKENHFALARQCGRAADFAAGISRLVSERPAGTTVEVEVENLEEFQAALDGGVDIIMLDDMSFDDIRHAVRQRDERAQKTTRPGPLLEVSGGVTLDRIADYAATGVERISVGALTHSVKALDIAMKIAVESPKGSGERQTTFPAFAGESCAWPQVWSKGFAVFESIVASTNDLAFSKAEEKGVEPVLVVAEEQSHGRGRRGDRWLAPRGSALLLSLAVSPKIDTRRSALVSPAAAIAVAEALQIECGLDARVKWPNDVWIGAKKIAGILLESRAIGGGTTRIVVGAGINVNQHAAWFKGQGLAPATSAAAETGRTFSRSKILATWLAKFAELIEKLEREDFAYVQKRFDELSYLDGRWVTLDCGGRITSGIVQRIDLIDGLRLEIDGQAETFPAAHTHIVAVS